MAILSPPLAILGVADLPARAASHPDVGRFVSVGQPAVNGFGSPDRATGAGL